jgi:hypothetical protein
VLHDVRERLGHDEVSTRFDLRCEPLGWDVYFDRQVDARHDRVDAGP